MASNLETRAEEYASGSGDYAFETAETAWLDGYRAALADAVDLVENYVKHKLNTTDDGWTPYPDASKLAAAIRRLGE